MSRIFATLALFAVGLLITNFCIGLFGGDYNGQYMQLLKMQQQLNQLRTDGDHEAATKMEQGLATGLTDIEPLQRHTRMHMLTGVLAALMTVLVNSIAVTYFVGTSRWCKEVVQTYDLAPDFIVRANRLKRGTFPWSLAGMLIVVGIIALGAASDPGTRRIDTAQWVTYHFMGAIVGSSLIAWALWVQFRNIRANHGIIEEVLAEVYRVRSERGLEV
ncbi:MAG: hypothetical protein R3E01_28745 [Pirellulaceae bacterium]|nr:hypothetical protein [Planctomycetales bacterium]